MATPSFYNSETNRFEYSDAAIAWVERNHGSSRSLAREGQHSYAAEEYDLIAADVLAKVKGTPIDLNDPRLVKGARVRWEDEDGVIEGTIGVEVGYKFLRFCGASHRYFHDWEQSIRKGDTKIYLLAEAPDPNRAARDAIIETLLEVGLGVTTAWVTDRAGLILASLQKRGVVK